MFKHFVLPAAFLLGLAAIGWVGAGYVGSNPLGAAVALLIGACYLSGASELYRYRQATATLQKAVGDLSVAPSDLASWLERLHPSLRHGTRLRIEGDRIALPAPALTPYLTGLLVLLGMLGTLLGMMATLRGTGFALESASDLQAIRSSLAAPVNGLAFAFGTSIAGVASSAMLGLLSALVRRERLQAVQLLDVKIATTLRVHSQAYQREEALRLLQQQTALMPALVDRLQSMMSGIEQQNLAAHERQIASHEAFHGKTEAVYLKLASSVEQTLKDSVTQGARAGASALQPVVEATMAGLAQQTTQLHVTITQAVKQQLEGLAASAESNTTTVARIWNEALAEQRHAHATLNQDLRGTLEQFTTTFEQRSTGLLEGMATRLDASAHDAAEAWNNALSQQQSANEDQAARNERALAAAGTTIEEHAASLVSIVRESHAELQATLESRDQQRLATWTETLGAMTSLLSQKWEQAGEHAASRQQAICDTLTRTASDISAQAQAHASETMAEISRLVQAASEAPKIAAEVVAELRQKLSDSMVRDTAMLEERGRLLETVETLLNAVNHASTEQRTAVDELVSTSASLLDRVGTRFIEHVEAETGKLGGVAAQVTGSAVEVASLGEAFGVAVQQYGQSNEALMDRLQIIADALDKSLARSDEQLAYYVMQAKEVVDLSMLAQKQIIEELQQIGGQPVLAGAETA
ncbi:DUF802 domain-containing protein [Dyella mobilis]|uniref:DUF802 domain-containing protein n=1 Tax=Dyella mobilis TaxID=1849582 RepID=A0ABS2KF81_9GAMM|nr:DUF802 domain-containing protein [Dyella mobilis]MBM7129023.1 DUF802 domain-containing protein [Dyella mobilis]GLQ99283.1 hypothetical protein GCM10007863_37030 [Dyella mobilis]